ncbi:G5 domain-containing protein [Agromyces atrinae]|uniref:G5 domain-containing protein n=1 Tax=Agromyces atrinae TaxID=592376 RepID=UPI001F575356|nr:G5 domain-containing protein [Agromyces atrinae]MCI2956246.1 G5 domain-containing protein [Agromyces atrinae]
MATPPPGWYTDPDVPLAWRWWTGSEWLPSGAFPEPPSGQPSAASIPLGTAAEAPPAARPLRPGLRPIVLAVIGLVAVILAASGSWKSLLVLGGGAAVVLSAIALSRSGRMPLIGTVTQKVALLALAGGVVVFSVGAVIPSPPPVDAASGVVGFVDAGSSSSPRAMSSPKPTPSKTPKPSPTPRDVVTYEDVVEALPFTSSTIEDPNSDVGVVFVHTAGAAGSQTHRYKITTRAGAEISREIVTTTVTVQPVAEVIAHGSRVPPPPPPPVEAAPADSGCHSSYADVCVPIDSDVDCAGGSGNGPSYVSGPLRVVGYDEYDLDRDGDGIACD